jgi:hypothetical protein
MGLKDLKSKIDRKIYKNFIHDEGITIVNK